MPWKARHRFAVTAAGHAATERYHQAVTSAQGGPDARAQLEAAKRTWSEDLKLRENDIIVLDELAAGAACLAEMQGALDALGLHLRDARGALDRLIAAGLIESLDPHPRA